MDTIRKYGQAPFQIALLHGGPGAPGDLSPVAEILSERFGILEFTQTKHSIDGLVTELFFQIQASAITPITLIGYSWGAWLGIIFTARFPQLVKKLILISSGALENKYNQNLMNVRMDRLTNTEVEELEMLISMLNSGKADNQLFKRFGQLMSKADSFDPIEPNDETLCPDVDQNRAIWQEASLLRDMNELVRYASKIKIPVCAIHGANDPHPLEGVEIPLSENLSNFKMICLQQCGHTPWREKHARDHFFSILFDEILFQ